MDKTPLDRLPFDVPDGIRPYVAGADIYDSSCSPEARVLFIDRGNGCYLKRSEKGALEKEAAMAGYFYSLGLGAEVLDYVSGDFDWLLTASLDGEDCIHEMYLSDPKRLCDTTAYELRRLHETDFSG